MCILLYSLRLELSFIHDFLSASFLSLFQYHLIIWWGCHRPFTLCRGKDSPFPFTVAIVVPSSLHTEVSKVTFLKSIQKRHLKILWILGIPYATERSSWASWLREVIDCIVLVYQWWVNTVFLADQPRTTKLQEFKEVLKLLLSLLTFPFATFIILPWFNMCLKCLQMYLICSLICYTSHLLIPTWGESCPKS